LPSVHLNLPEPPEQVYSAISAPNQLRSVRPGGVRWFH
jgi:uncharacterized protein YndB with AHSA1/START domain